MKLEEIVKKLQTVGKDRFLLLFFAGIMLVIIAMPISDGKKGEEQGKQKVESAKESSDEVAATGQMQQEDLEQYRNRLCRQLEEFLSRMDGVGQAKVYITMHSSEEIIVERNSPYTKRTEEETMSDGSRVTAEVENESEVVLVEQEDGSSGPIIVKEIVPTVRGVVVAAQGGDNERVKNEITALVMALFGIEEHKIRVVKLST